MNCPDFKGEFLTSMAAKNLKKVNKEWKLIEGGTLKTLWSWLGFGNIGVGAYADYVDNPEKAWIWWKYSNKKGFGRSMFWDVDSIKLTRIMVDQIFHLWNATWRGFIIELFPLHNYYELKGSKEFKTNSWKMIEDFIVKNEIQNEDREIFEPEKQSYITKQWWNLILCPASKIWNYYGEKIAMYFSFLSYYTIMLIIPTVVGIPCFIIQLIDNWGYFYSIPTIIYTLILVLWMTVLYEYWKRKEILNSILWGQTDFEEE